MGFQVPEKYRVTSAGSYSSTAADSNNGVFRVPLPRRPGTFPHIAQITASDGEGWEHVSVSLRHRSPKWDEMEYFKRLFWGDDVAVMQLHPPRSQWVNNHPHCLHLWRPIDASIPMPPSLLVGYRDSSG